MTVADGSYPERGTSSFWRDLGLDTKAAEAAANCFPEGMQNRSASKRVYVENIASYYVENDSEESARRAARNMPVAYRMDPKHPAFWFEQGCSFDEMVRRVVLAITVEKMQKEAVPPPPPQRDRFAEVAQVLLLQGAMQQSLEGPDSYDDQDYDDPQPRRPVPPQQEPFNPDDYPRFQTRPS